jgi:hypothetical protein
VSLHFGTRKCIGADDDGIDVNDFLKFQVDLSNQYEFADDISAWVWVTDNIGESILVYESDLNGVLPQPILTSLPTSADVGDNITLLGEHFTPNTPITVFLVDTQVSSMQTSVNGSFSATFLVPDDMDYGDYFVEAVDDEDKFAFGILTILKTIPISVEGEDYVWLMLLIVLIIAGSSVIIYLKKHMKEKARAAPIQFFGQKL